MRFNISNKLSFVDSFKSLSALLESLIKYLKQYDFKYLSQEFDNDVLDLFKQKGFYLYGYMTDFGKFEVELSSAAKFCSPLNDRKITDTEYNMLLTFGKNFK